MDTRKFNRLDAKLRAMIKRNDKALTKPPVSSVVYTRIAPGVIRRRKAK
jgi:hypothetical protein